MTNASEHNQSEPRPLDELRQSIDGLDQQIVDLLARRAELVVEVGESKRDTNTPIYAPHRERAVLDRIQSLNKGPLSNHTLECIYRELMSGSFSLEQALRIGYLGPPGSFQPPCRGATLRSLRRLRGVRRHRICLPCRGLRPLPVRTRSL